MAFVKKNMQIQRNIVETLVGIIVLALCAVFIIIVYKASDITTNSQSYILNASFDRADGLEPGAYVTVSGVKIGKVLSKSLDSNTYNAIVEMSINKSVSLPTDTSAEITSSGLLGDKYIALIPGSDSSILKDKSVIEFTQSSINIETMLNRMIFGIEMNQNKYESEVSEIDEDSPNNSNDTSHNVQNSNNVNGENTGNEVKEKSGDKENLNNSSRIINDSKKYNGVHDIA